MIKKVIIICFILLAVLLGGVVIIFNGFEREKVKLFNLNDEPYYLQAIQDFPSNKFLGEILTAEEAKQKAVEEWVSLFGDKIKDEKPYQVFFDEKNDIWLVKGFLPKGWKGGVAYILIQKSDGKILAIWHDQ
jgi:hypothetical protein